MLFVLWDFVRGMALFRFTVISIPLLNWCFQWPRLPGSLQALHWFDDPREPHTPGVLDERVTR
jgi:hypothetical protein